MMFCGSKKFHHLHAGVMLTLINKLFFYNYFMEALFAFAKVDDGQHCIWGKLRRYSCGPSNPGNQEESYERKISHGE